MCVNKWKPVTEGQYGQIDISSCGCCYRLQFNNILMTLDPDSLEQFYFEIQACYLVVKDETDRDTRALCFNSKLPNLAFMYSVAEITELNDMLESSILQSAAYS